MERDGQYGWEQLPEYLATQEYSRCVGRVLASLPGLLARRSVEPLTFGAIRIGAGIVGYNAELPAGEELLPEERAAFLEDGLEGLRSSRRRLRRLRRWHLGDPEELGRALKLLDQIETWIRAGPMVAGPVN